MRFTNNKTPTENKKNKGKIEKKNKGKKKN